MAFTFAGVTWPWWFTDPALVLLAIIAGLMGRGVWLARQERLELEQEGSSNEYSQAQEDGPAFSDDHYPAAPALSQAGPSADPGGRDGRASGGPAEQDLPQQPPDRQHSGPHYLAAVTQGETLQEEIDRLEGRLAALYQQQREEAAEAGKALAAQVAASELAVEQILAEGWYAIPWWLEPAPADPLELTHDGQLVMA